ncbi:O-methyltransferase [Saccharothrix ecbatanensis]|uniref:O-methyltransferase n=1 Tax=Saccharothrix ecbatanensis TaxID=1105145 RepID=A0A7W9LZJ3_9PSEU|nr:TylF/MycF/NovP-related O-methyltransferase [Saccharothrix ecbatanensis]MBB5801940.1 O-methyltransferase [Saccharothrix ecbatanensis]
MADELLARNSWSSMDHLNAIYWSLSSVLLYNRPGAVLEVGCNAGHTSVWLQRVIQDFAPERELHLFDSFAGLPTPGQHDVLLGDGDLVVTEEQVKENFADWDLPTPAIHAGWFVDTLPSYCPRQVAFAYLDGDYYESILTSLEYVYPRLVPGGVILIDDYCDAEQNPRAWDGFPGVKMACDDYFRGRPNPVEVLAGSARLAVGAIRKPLDGAGV